MSIVLAYHGCSIKTAHALLGGSNFKLSDKEYDWLGSGAYFWEWDCIRAYDWAIAFKGKKDASLVGAAIELGNCLDLTTRSGAFAVEQAYIDFVDYMNQTEEPLPENKASKANNTGNLDLRFLDRAVITHLHKNMKDSEIED